MPSNMGFILETEQSTHQEVGQFIFNLHRLPPEPHIEMKNALCTQGHGPPIIMCLSTLELWLVMRKLERCYAFFFPMLMLVQTRDTNSVTNPCEALPRLKAKDAITLAVGFTGDVSKWYNNTNPSGSLLSPCSSKLATQLPVNSKVAVFRPILDQLSIFQISNASYAQLVQDFPGGASLVVYAGNPTIISAPRYFIVPYGRIPQFTLILEFEKGNLIRLLWKDDKCEPCGASSGACFQGSCATQATVCLNMDLSSNVTTDDCRLAVNVAFSGTDKNNELFNSWYQIKSIGQYSLTRLYEKTKNDALNSLFNDFEPLIGSP